MVTPVPLQLAHAHGGSGELWVNPEHIVTLQPIRSDTGTTVVLQVEVKMAGMNLVRARLGTHTSATDADAAWVRFLTSLNARASNGGGEERRRRSRRLDHARAQGCGREVPPSAVGAWVGALFSLRSTGAVHVPG